MSFALAIVGAALSSHLTDRPAAAVISVHATLAGGEHVVADAGQEAHVAHAQESGDTYRWDRGPVTFGYNPAGGPPGADGWSDSIFDAASAWNAMATGAPFLEPAGLSSAGTEACDYELDGQNTIGWAALPAEFLARTCVVYGERLPDGRWSIVEFDMQFNWHMDEPSFVAWATDDSLDAYDFEAAMLHELGHVLGLGHAAACPGPVMCATLYLGQATHLPGADDVAALAAIYPPGVVLDQSLQLAPGWSLISWDGPATPVAEAVAQAEGAIVAVFAVDAATGRWLRFAAGTPGYVNTLHTLQPGQAYWVTTEAGATLPVQAR